MINVSNLSFSFGDRVLFDNVSFVIGKNQKIGLVGPNGAGKSTLLSLISKTRESELGRVQVLGTIASVAQEIKNDPILENSETVRIYLDPGHEHHDFELRKMLDGLELSNIDFAADPRQMSGGQKTRLALIRALLAKPDILLLDEPTNFLDVGGKQWVMNFLSTYPNTVLLISHDLSLLDKSIDKIFFINSHTKKVDEYTGNYSQFLRLKEEKTTLVKKQVKSGKQHIQSLEEGLKKGNQSVRVRIQMQKRIEREKDKLPQLPT
ncbi:MAG: ATP-binding cassette domain-containing protein, partial [bacterium]|nr:ATP-binding cassette domain-containing protein [bacterium]